MMLQDEDTWPFVASIIYTTAWCVSFYPQLYQNYKLKSVQGFPLNYVAISLTGWTCYFAYTTLGYFTDIRGAGTVVLFDFIFVCHAMLMVSLGALQCCFYKKGKNSLPIYAVLIVIAVWLFQIIEALLYAIGIVGYFEYWNPLTVLGYGKLLITCIRYSPPVYWNYKRKSTKGWSISSIIFDLIGGICSMASGGLSVQNGLNITKVILAFITIIYDLIFCFQHYVLYRKRDKKIVVDVEENSLVSQIQHTSK